MTGKNTEDRDDWMVFQQDVLDVLRQYQGFFDFTERVGSLSDDSRPDFVARVSREEKKEIWILDAKKKPELNDEDRKRMRKYLEMLESNPIDLGLEISELTDYCFRGIFVTSRGNIESDDFEQVKFSNLHQFLQRELVYTETDKVVRDVAKMAERKQLSQSQARLLFRSLKPFEEVREKALERLRDIENTYTGFRLETSPFEESMPVEAKLVHEARDKVFMIDIPYSRDALDKIGSKVDEIRESLDEEGKEVFFAAVNAFGEERDSEYIYSLEELGTEISSTASVLSPEKVAGIFTPKISTEKTWEDGFLKVRDTQGLGFRLRVYTQNDISYRIEAEMLGKAIEEMKERMLNSRKEFGKVEERKFSLEFDVTDEGMISYSGRERSLKNFRDEVRTIYQSSINPVLSRDVTATVE
ncbi:MAG: hypothetical protein ABEK10_00195 [Candidatus Nanosalina sp.]